MDSEQRAKTGQPDEWKEGHCFTFAVSTDIGHSVQLGVIELMWGRMD